MNGTPLVPTLRDESYPSVRERPKNRTFIDWDAPPAHSIFTGALAGGEAGGRQVLSYDDV
jgi:hypothetical protein